MYQTIEILFRFIVYFVVLVCGWIVVTPLIRPLFQKMHFRQRFRSLASSTEKERARSDGLVKHISQLLVVSTNRKGTFYVTTFFLLSAGLSAFTFALLVSVGQSMLNALALGLLLGTGPYIYLRISTHIRQVGGSYEAEPVITELSNQYKTNGLNMLEGIDKAIPRLKDFPHSRRALLRVSMGVKEMQSPFELDEIIEQFYKSYETEWAALLSNILHSSIKSRDDVTPAIEDLIGELKTAREVREKDRQENAESFFMVKYAGPGIYVLSVFVMIYWFGFTTSKYFAYQFKTAAGFQSFLYILISYGASLVAYLFMRKPKNDL